MDIEAKTEAKKDEEKKESAEKEGDSKENESPVIATIDLASEGAPDEVIELNSSIESGTSEKPKDPEIVIKEVSDKTAEKQVPDDGGSDDMDVDETLTKRSPEIIQPSKEAPILSTEEPKPGCSKEIDKGEDAKESTELVEEEGPELTPIGVREEDEDLDPESHDSPEDPSSPVEFLEVEELEKMDEDSAQTSSVQKMEIDCNEDEAKVNEAPKCEQKDSVQEFKEKDAVQELNEKAAVAKIKKEVAVADIKKEVAVADIKKEDAVSKPKEKDEVQEVTPMEICEKPAEQKSSIASTDMGKIINEKIRQVMDEEEFVFYGKECVNYECEQSCKTYFTAPLFVLNFYKSSGKFTKIQYVCEDCYNKSISKYEELAGALVSHQPLLLQDIKKNQEFVEILDSSDEEDDKVKGEKDEGPGDFQRETIDFLSEELDATIGKMLKSVDIEDQVNWTKNILQKKIKQLEEDSDFISESLKALQKSADAMHNSLYQCPKIKIKELPALDLNTGRTYVTESEMTIPPVGELTYPPIEINGSYFAVKNNVIASWLPCKAVEFIDSSVTMSKTVKYYRVKFHKMKIPTVKCVPAKHMAYGDPPKVRLPIGTRIIALFDGSTLSRNKEKIPNFKSAFYPGIIAEPLQSYNKYRYLIFFDDGYAQYVCHKDVRVVCQVSDNVWDDVHPSSREFIHNYLTHYQRNRPMVQVRKGQSMITESNGKWLYAKAVDIDASLVQMLFDGQNRTEWIYRGSTRLGPLFREKQTKRSMQVSQLPRRSEPYVRYWEDEEATKNDAYNNAEKQNRAVAKKSTASRNDNNQPIKHLNNSTIFLDDNKPKGKVVYYTAKKNMPPRSFSPHECSSRCLFNISHNLSSYSPLAKPLLSGWERQIFKSKLKKFVVYRTPCGRRVRNMEELHKYLRQTKNSLNVDNFDFDILTHCLAEFVIETCLVQKLDLSEGAENMIIPCINYYDNTMPPQCTYSTKRIPTEGVNLNLDPEFLTGCDCEDDCQDKSKCSCWQLTIQGARFGNPNTPPESVGYQYKRLPEAVPTGIYECNAKCKCSKSCLNRVVQHPLQMKLQVFKTSNRGWGLRCINDVPKGSFICIYAGHLLTEQNANEGGANSGDEYFAELDYIEVVERLKEGYESDVQEDVEESEEEYEEPARENDSDEDFRLSVPVNKNNSINTRLRSRRSTTEYSKKSNDDDEEEERQVINFEANTSLDNEENTTTKYKSIRKYYGKNEFCYVMDAKKTGNIGRYFNHSCSPNLFVQNVFVDTHDLRFPWVAFFALTHIRAGAELTWNYNYEVGIVPGKVLFCECGAANCRGRLL